MARGTFMAACGGGSVMVVDIVCELQILNLDINRFVGRWRFAVHLLAVGFVSRQFASVVVVFFVVWASCRTSVCRLYVCGAPVFSEMS